MLLHCLFALASLVGSVAAFDYRLVGAGSISLTDLETGIGEILTIFTDELIGVAVDGITWEPTESVDQSDDTLYWETLIDGEVQSSGSMSLADVGRELPTSIDAGSVKTSEKGRRTIQVRITVDSKTASTKTDVQAYAAGVALIPLVIVLLLAVITNMVEISLCSAIFVGACMVTGNINDGFKAAIDNYILNAVADADHVYVVLFTLFLSGLVGMMQKSGGMTGFTKDVASIATTPRLGQFACFAVGLFIFFDDYANVLLAGETMRPLLDVLFISREKLSFIVDATAAPIASISPVSSWVGFEVGLIQEQIDRIIVLEGTDDLSIKTSGFGVFLQSIKYRYYPIFMIILIMFLIYSGRDFGPMLIAERKTRVYKRSDGGEGKGKGSEMEGSGNNKPKKDTPEGTWNLVVPVVILIFFIFYLMVKTGESEDGESQSLMDKIESSDSYSALLWGTMAASICTCIFYLIQIVQDGEFVIPTLDVLKRLMPFRNADEDDPMPRSIMSVFDCSESFLFGMGRIFPALIVLNLAWASGAIMVAVGADRLFSRWIVGGVAPEALPTLAFIISLFVALATGTSWGTMSILFPLIMVPTWQASEGDATIFYATVAGVLSGSVAGDHISPISDTTVLSALACDCTLLGHVSTQAPYAIVCILVSIILGTVPIGYDGWPNIVGILFGVGVLGAFVFGLCPQVISPTGNFDIFVELFLKFNADSPLHQLKADTVKVFNGEEINVDVTKKHMDDASAEESDEVLPQGSDEPEKITYMDADMSVEGEQQL